jgi:hypothetical protein
MLCYKYAKQLQLDLKYFGVVATLGASDSSEIFLVT